MKRLLAAVAMPLSLSLACATPSMPEAHGAIKPGAFAPPAVPGNLKAPEGAVPELMVEAKGVQIYVCGKNPAGAWAWNFKAPEAALSDTKMKPLGKHYAGPSWEGLDGGKVMGAVKANMPAPAAGAIPWLLLDIKSREGTGAFTDAKAIVRLNTSGGAAPGPGCDEAHAGSESRVPYTATYLFLK